MNRSAMISGSILMLAVLTAAPGCSSSGSTSDGSTDGSGGAGGAGGATQCGERACTGGELCVHPSCGGAPPICSLLGDGGECPQGWTLRSACTVGGVSGPGCEPPPCTPPASYCLTLPASCGGNPTCACLPGNVCQGGGSCSGISQGEVLCISG